MPPALLPLLLLQLGGTGASRWIAQPIGTSADLRAVCAVSEAVCWTSGSRGTWARTMDGGHTWYAHILPSAATLDFRYLSALDETHAFLLNSGLPARIYRTDDGGRVWKLTYENQTAGIRFAGLAFWDLTNGLAFGDPVEGRFLVITTADAGATWHEVPAASLPPPLPGEKGIPVSGTALAVQGTSNAWFGTGGGRAARIFRSTDRGRTWAASPVPLPSSPTAGVTSIAFADARGGLAVGSEARKPKDPGPNVARTTDGGVTWRLAGRTRPGGQKESVAIVPGTAGPSWVVTGPAGTSLSTDLGATWSWLDAAPFHAVSFAGPINAGWAVGSNGRIAVFQSGVGTGTRSTAVQEEQRVIGAPLERPSLGRTGESAAPTPPATRRLVRTPAPGTDGAKPGPERDR